VYPPEVSEARFHAITTSYDVLRGRRTTLDPNLPDGMPHPRVDLHALWRAKQRRHHDPMEPVDDRWKDGIILGSLFLVRNFRFVPVVKRRIGRELKSDGRAGSRGIYLPITGITASEDGGGGASNF
jgi:hypothetical protein